jgi:hypothetical protein
MDTKDPRQIVQGELGPEMSHNASGAVDARGYPTMASAAIDAGVVIEGITDGYKGKAPDLGAYESGAPRWVAGADWQDPEVPAKKGPSLAYAPCEPITAKTMIMDGLELWFDAADKASVEFADDGSVLAWHDKSRHRRVARPAQEEGMVTWVADGMNGKPVLRGNGTRSLRVADIKGQTGAVTAFVVSQALEARGPSWQRIVANFTGKGQEWVWPNWMVGAPGGRESSTWSPRISTVLNSRGTALGTVTVLGASASQGQALGGDVAEVLVFSRTLRFDELEAVQEYLRSKWGIGE